MKTTVCTLIYLICIFGWVMPTVHADATAPAEPKHRTLNIEHLTSKVSKNSDQNKSGPSNKDNKSTSKPEQTSDASVKLVKVLLSTNQGDITLELNKQKAPISVANFLHYVESGFYSGTLFHRVMDGFMIQGGGFNKSMQKKPTAAPIKNEADNGLSNDRYTVAMARTSDPDSATAQFYINLADNSFLNKSGPSKRQAGYAVFGKVIAGQEVVDSIAKLKTRPMGPHQHVPATPVIIKQATIID